MCEYQENLPVFVKKVKYSVQVAKHMRERFKSREKHYLWKRGNDKGYGPKTIYKALTSASSYVQE